MIINGCVVVSFILNDVLGFCRVRISHAKYYTKKIIKYISYSVVKKFVSTLMFDLPIVLGELGHTLVTDARRLLSDTDSAFGEKLL